MNEKRLIKRVAALEAAVGRLQHAISGIAQGINIASRATISCSVCENDYTAMKYCPEPDCPCGLEPNPKGEEEDDSEVS